MSLFKKISLIGLCSSLLFACATPPRKPPVSATELANTQLRPTPVVAPSGQPVPALSHSPGATLKQVNQSGVTPPAVVLNERLPEGFKLTDDTPVNLNFEQVDLRQIIETIADSLGISMVIDPTIGDKVNLRTSDDKPLKKSDLWPLLQLLLNDAGISMEKKGNVYHLKKLGPTLPKTISSSTTSLNTDAPEVLQVTPLRYVSIESAIAVLNPIIQPQGRLIAMPSLNVIGIISTPQRLERINKLLTVIDADPFVHRGMRLFRLMNTKAVETQASLDKILKAVSGNMPPYQAIALEKINAILVVAPPNTSFDEVARWVEILDERSEGGEQVFIYRVKNLESKSLAGTLSNVFKLDDKKTDIKPTTPTPVPPPTVPGQPPIPQPIPELPSAFSSGVSADLKVTIVSDEATNSLIIRARPNDYRQLLDTIAMLDRIPKEVMVNVVIAEVTLTKSSQFGIDWRAFFGKEKRNMIGSDFNIPSTTMPANLNSPVAIPTDMRGLVIEQISGRITSVLNLIASDNDVRLLSRPSILVRNNQDATINVGFNEPIVTQSSTYSTGTVGTTPYTSNAVQYKDTGITLKVTPRINDDGIINMKISQEVSKLAGTRTTQNLQAFSQRKVETSVVISDGSAIVIGGLIETSNTNNQQGIPGVKDVPYVGKAFSSSDLQDVRTELVLIIVPEIVNPQEDSRVLLQRFKKRMEAISALLNEQDILVDGFLDKVEPPTPPPAVTPDPTPAKVEEPVAPPKNEVTFP